MRKHPLGVLSERIIWPSSCCLRRHVDTGWKVKVENNSATQSALVKDVIPAGEACGYDDFSLVIVDDCQATRRVVVP